MDGPWSKYQPATDGPWAKYAAPKAAEAQPDPTGSGFQNFAAGVGAKVTDLGLGAKQRFDEAANFLESKLGGQGVSKALGMPTAADTLAQTNQAVEEKRKLDAPLMKTTGGKIGAVTGAAVPALVAGMVPGGQGLAGSIITGAGLGAAEPTVGDESVAKNAAIGGVGGAAGYGLGRGMSAIADRSLAKTAATKSANAVKDAAGVESRAAGYTIPPTQTNPTAWNKALEGLAGKISTGQAASVKNQSVTNSLIRKGLGLPDDAPLTIDTLKAVRQQAGQAYDGVRSFGQVASDGQFDSQLMNIVQGSRGASRSFPGLGQKQADEIEAVITSIRRPQFDAGDAVDAMKILRESADAAYAKGDKGLGKAYKSASDALEGILERNLAKGGNPDALKQFRDARQLIAKTYSVEKALNATTGNISAPKLGAQLARGKPLSGELETVAKMGQAYPKAAQEITSSIPGVSPLDFIAAGGLSAASGNPLLMATAAARPVARSVILNPAYQKLAGAPKYGTSLADLLALQPAQEGVRLTTIGASPQLAQQK